MLTTSPAFALPPPLSLLSHTTEISSDLSDHLMETNTDFTHAIDLRRDERQRSLLDTEITSVAIKTLANEFLNVPGLDLDLRAWIVDTTLPTVLIALEKLLRQVEKKHLVGTRAGKEGDETAPHARSSNEHAIPSAAEGLPQEPDKPIERFDSINWLGERCLMVFSLFPHRLRSLTSHSPVFIS